MNDWVLSGRAMQQEQGNDGIDSSIESNAELRRKAEFRVTEEIAAKEQAKNEAVAKQQYNAYVTAMEKMHKKGLLYTAEQLQADLASIDEKLDEDLASIEATFDEQMKAAQSIANEKERLAKINSLKQAKLDAQTKARIDAENKKKDQKALKESRDAQLESEQQIAQKKLQNQQKYEQSARKGQEALNALSAKGMSAKDRLAALKGAATDEETGKASLTQALSSTIAALSNFAASLNKSIEDIAKKQSTINTRLQGSDKKWQDINKTFNKVAGASPLIKQEDLVANLESMVEAGINYNVEQRAFLATISKKIATTFNAADSTMLKLIRLQQKDSTAARLGMESAITAFLNNMYENTEYLKGVADGVRSNLAEAESLMSDTGAIEFEYQMQKWLGSLYSVGMSQDAVNNIAGAVGKLAAGDISGITSGGTSNLLMMAANKAGVSITEAMSDGLDASKTNSLMKAMVEYLAGLYENSKNSKVLQQQFAQVYGVKASDLKAAVNLANDNSETISAISNNNLTYSTAMQQLTNMAGTMYQRTSMGEMLENGMANFKYTMASGIANNPVLYSLYKTAGVLDDVVGGIAIPAISVFGNMVDLHTTVADLMRATAMSGSIMSGVGGIINSLGGLPSMWGTNMLKTMGISSVKSVKRGSGIKLTTSGVDVSESTYQGNASGGDVLNKTFSDANEQKEQEAVAAKDENDPTNQMPTNVQSIAVTIKAMKELLDNVMVGTKALTIKPQLPSTWSLNYNASNPGGQVS